MGTIRNRLTIVHDYDKDRINETRQNAVKYFGEIIQKEFGYIDYDVDIQLISPVLQSFINGEYTFVIMGDCSKLGWEVSENFEQYRNEWIKQNKGMAKNILVADFGEGDNDAFITEY